jgi:hypothetical protein
MFVCMCEGGGEGFGGRGKCALTGILCLLGRSNKGGGYLFVVGPTGVKSATF